MADNAHTSPELFPHPTRTSQSGEGRAGHLARSRKCACTAQSRSPSNPAPKHMEAIKAASHSQHHLPQERAAGASRPGRKGTGRLRDPEKNHLKGPVGEHSHKRGSQGRRTELFQELPGLHILKVGSAPAASTLGKGDPPATRPSGLC